MSSVFIEKDFVEKDFVEKDFVEKDFVEKDFVEKDFVEKDMAITRADFARLLPGALHGLPCRADDAGFRIGTDEAGVDIALEPLPERRIALITLPRLRVTLTFRGWTEGERQGFLHRFDTAFRRGGG